MAIVLSSIFFGITHPVIQQSLLACLLGMLIAFVAVQTRSLLPALLYHMTHNGLMVGMGWVAGWAKEPLPADSEAAWLHWLAQRALGTPSEAGLSVASGGWLYHWGSVAVFALLAALLVRAFARLPQEKTEEERLQEALSRQTLERATAA